MALLWAGTSLSDFTTQINTPTVETGGNVAPGCLEGIDLNDNEQVGVNIEDPISVSSSGGELWIAFHRGVGGSGNTCNFELFDTAFDPVNPVIRINGENDMVTADVRLWNGASFDTIVGPTSEVTNALKRYDIQIVRDDTAGIVRIYVDNVLDEEITLTDTNLSAWTQLDRLLIRGGNSAGGDGFRVSGIMIADEDTREWVLVQEDWTGAGNSNTFSTGDFNDIDDQSGVNDLDFLVSEAASQKILLTGDISDTYNAGYEVIASCISVRCTSGSGSPNQIRGVTRISTTDHVTTAKSPPSSPEIGVVQFIESVSPATAIAWTVSELENAETGVETA